jgi:hypothetical protein
LLTLDDPPVITQSSEMEFRYSCNLWQLRLYCL